MRLEEYTAWAKDQHRLVLEVNQSKGKISRLNDSIVRHLDKCPGAFSISVLLYYRSIPHNQQKRVDWPDWYDKEEEKLRLSGLRTSVESCENTIQTLRQHIFEQLRTESSLTQHELECFGRALSYASPIVVAFLSNYRISCEKYDLGGMDTTYSIRGKLVSPFKNGSPIIKYMVQEPIPTMPYKTELQYDDGYVTTETKTIQEYLQCDDFGTRLSVSSYNEEHLDLIFRNAFFEARHLFNAWADVQDQTYYTTGLNGEWLCGSATTQGITQTNSVK